MEKRKLYLSKMKAASPFAHELAPFVPWSVVKYFKTEGDATYGLWKFSAAVMVVDITGFTRLGETLAKLPGMLGVELLATYINGYFAQLIDVIVAYGGSVEKFAGDALIVVFGSQFGEVPLESLNAAALNCAMAIQQKHGKYPVKVSWGGCEEELELTVHIGIGVSPNMRTVTVGGLGGSWRKLMLGNVFSQLATSVPLAGSSEVVISKQSAEFVRRSKTADMFVIEERRAESASEQDEVTDFAVRLKDGLSASNLPSGKALPDLVISTAMEKGVRGFVDLFVQSRIDEGQPQISESRTLSILFIGINGWDDLSQSVTSTSTEGFSTLHQLTRSIQQIVYTYEGCIANFLVDEKGCSVIITYGIPQHPDDALLAIRSALDMKEASSKLGVGLSIAVTTGEIFVGTIGSSRRKDFSIMGSPVNLAARLMGLCSQIHADQASEKWRSERRSQTPAPSEAKCMREAACEVPRIDRDDTSISGSEMDQDIWSQIVVDEKTFQLTKRTTLYRTDLEPIEVRGCEAKQCVYAPVQLFRGRRDFEAHQRAVGEGGEDPFVEDEEREIVLISRSTELRALEEMRDEVAMKNPLPSPKMPGAAFRTRIAFVHAEGGMGKSYLIRVCIAPVEKREIPGLVLESQQTHQGSKDSLFSIWEPVYKQLLLSNRPPLSSKKQHLLDFFKVLSKTEEYGMEFGYMENFDLSCCLALLNPVLKTRFNVPAAVADLGSVLRVKTQACLLHLILKHFSQTQPLFILFDQFEVCLDMPSLELLQRIAESKDKLSPIMIVCSMRPMDTTAASVATLEAQRVLQKIQSCESAMTVNLRPLTEQVATELFLHLLNGQLRSHLEVPELKEVSLKMRTHPPTLSSSHHPRQCDPALAKFVYNNSQNGKTYLLVAIVNVCRDNLVCHVFVPDSERHSHPRID